MDNNPTNKQKAAQFSGIILLIALTFAVSGFFMGLRQNSNYAEHYETDTRYRAQSSPHATIPAQDEARQREILEIVDYRSLGNRKLQANAAWMNHLDQLQSQLPQAVATPQSEVERKAVLERRLERRAYDGAPPVIPHAIDQRNGSDCLKCHGEDRVIRGRVLPRMSHPELGQCFQCHVPESGLELAWDTDDYRVFVANHFEGEALSKSSAPAYDGAPAMIPHTTFMRDDCMSCHGGGRPHAIVTPHPERQSCTQCHAPNAQLDQRPLPNQP